MMNGTTDGYDQMMWGMGLGALLVITLVVLGIAALAKYLIGNTKR